jgi:hypothetical protein
MRFAIAATLMFAAPGGALARRAGVLRGLVARADGFWRVGIAQLRLTLEANDCRAWWFPQRFHGSE